MAAFGSDVDPALYRERIWPRLGAVKLAEIMEATGDSKGYCSTIRSREVDAARLDMAGASNYARPWKRSGST